MIPSVLIGARTVGAGNPCLVIAEIGVNHGGSLDTARRLIEKAAAAGADCVKFQAFAADRLATAAAPKAAYQHRATDTGESQREMLRSLEMSIDDLGRAAEASREYGLMFLATPFDEISADGLDALGVPAFKVASGEITNLPFLRHVARKRRPVILSTGMATIGDVDRAIGAVTGEGCDEIVLMHCVSQYPAAPADANLRAIGTMSTVFSRPCGYSDHTLGHDVAVAALALGACTIEKHLTLDKAAAGPDHAASLEPAEFAAMVRAIRTAESALGSGRKAPVAAETEMASAVRKSLVAARRIPVGAVLTDDALELRRPGSGLPPAAREAVVGRTARVDIPAGAVISVDMLA